MSWSCVLLKLPVWLPAGHDSEPGEWPALLNHLVPKGETLVAGLGGDSGGDAWALGVIQTFCERLGLRGIDCQTGQILDFGEATAQSAREFRAWRDRALGRDPE